MEVNLTALFATTKERISRKLFDSLPERIPLAGELKKAGNLKEVVDGGRSFSEPALIDDSSAVGAYVGTDALNVSQQGGIEKFQYTPAFIYGSVFMAGTELAMNAGDQQAVSLLEARIKQMRDSKLNEFDKFLNGKKDDAGTGQGNWIGIQDIISDDATATIPGTGVDRVANVKTRNQVDTTSIATAAAFNTSQAGRNVFTNLYLQSSFGAERPKLGLLTRTIFAAYNLSLQANERFVGNMSQANGGFPFITFMIDMKMTWGDNVLSGHAYFINPNMLKIKILKNKNFKFRGFLPSHNQDLEVDICTTGGQLTSGAPKYHGVWTGGGF